MLPASETIIHTLTDRLAQRERERDHHDCLLIATAIRTSEIFVKKPSQVMIARAVRFIDAINNPMRIERTYARTNKATQCTVEQRQRKVHRE